MDTKLTLKLNQEIIEKAKQYAADKKLSLSRLIENYLHNLTVEKTKPSNLQISPFVKSLSTKLKLPVDYDLKKDRTEYLENKYK